MRVAVLTHPSSQLGDFYREMGDLFGIELLPSNRWGGFRDLRERWLAHLDDTRMRPLLLVDEAQETPDPVFAEIRLLAATDFDSRAILSVVFAGDNRLLARLRRPDLKPIASRMRQRLVMAPAEPEELAQLLDHLLEQAGNPGLMTTGLKDTLVAHASGNPRALAIMADGLLAAAAEHDRDILDEKLFIETWGEPTQSTGARR